MTREYSLFQTEVSPIHVEPGHRQVRDLSTIVKDSVSGNTFRAFARLPNRPSVTFRRWAEAELQGVDTLKGILQTTSQEKYDFWLRVMVSNLSAYWQKEMGRPMAYGPARKLTNLVVKHLILWRGLTNKEKGNLKQMAHVPLDEYTLVGVRRCVDWVSIPKKPSMSFVATEPVYNGLQEYIRGVARNAMVPPIYYDILAWNLAHDNLD